MLRLIALNLLSFIIFIISFCSFQTIKKVEFVQNKSNNHDSTAPNLLEKILQNDTSLVQYLKKSGDLKIQIIYTKIDRNKSNIPNCKDFFYNVDSSSYFYPASTVKLPTALLALEKLNKLNIPSLNSSSTMITEKDYGLQSAVYNDPSSKFGKPSVEQYVKKIFLVSDNDAMNRLYEFVGQQPLNESLHAKGYKEAQIIHRLNISLSEDENRHTNPVYFLDSTGKKIYEQQSQFSQLPYFTRNNKIGTGYLSNGKLLNEPLDFSKKNSINLLSLHNILKSVMFPEIFPVNQRFNLSGKDLFLVRKAMSEFPTESLYPSYSAPEFYPTYCKFLMYGAEKDAKLIPDLRIFNKVGDAYGFLLDVAYVADFKNNIEFMLSAVIYCNSDGILNDDNYDYDTVGFPFLKKLGLAVYDYELKRNRKFEPDLTSFKINYTEAPSNK
jgi:hypothetical protein